MACPANTVLASAATNGFFNPDPQTLQVIIAQLTCDLKAAVSSPTLTADNINLTLGYDQPHALGAVPSRVRFVLKFTSAAAGGGYAVGDEVDGSCIYDGINEHPTFSFGANATNVWVHDGGGAFLSGDAKVVSRVGSSIIPVDNTNVVGKLYVWR